jgi:hypothetical protein
MDDLNCMVVTKIVLGDSVWLIEIFVGFLMEIFCWFAGLILSASNNFKMVIRLLLATLRWGVIINQPECGVTQ